MAAAFPVPADDELIDLRSQLRLNLARVARKSKECGADQQGSRIFKLKEKMTQMASPASRFAKYVEEDDAREKAVKGNGTGGLRPTKVLSPPPGALGCPVVDQDDQDDPKTDQDD